MEKHWSWTQFFAVFKDWKTYAYGLLSLAACTPMFSLSMFLPSIIRDLGFDDIKAQAMISPIYAIGKIKGYILYYIYMCRI